MAVDKTPNNLALRMTSAAVLAPLAVGVYILGGVFWLLFLALVAAGMAYEWFTITGNRKPALNAVFLTLVFLGLLFRPSLLFLGIFAALPALLSRKKTKKTEGKASFWPTLLAGPAITFPLGCLALTGWISSLALLWLVLTVWATDTLAMLFGKTLGGPRLAPTISPKKTWAGLFGAIFGGLLVTWLFFALLPALPTDLWYAAVIFPLLAQGGDLLESVLKRRFKVKDSGSLIPGHGGLLDRTDSFLLTAPALWFILSAGWLSFS